MSNFNKKTGLIIGMSAALLLLAGNVFAAYIVHDEADKKGIRIDVCNVNFYLNSVDEANKLTNNWDGTWSTDEINSEYGLTYNIVDDEGNDVGSSYTTTTKGTYVFTYDISTDATSVDVISKYVYFKFLPMLAGNHNGRVWNQFYCYAWNSGDDSIKNANWPGVQMTEVNTNGLYELQLAGNLDSIIFNNNGDQDDHMIQTGNLSYDISKPLFGCTSKISLTTYVANASPSIDDEASFDYYLHTSHNEWAERSKAYGFEKTQDNNQYLLRCYLENGDELGIKDNGESWWGGSNLGNSGEGFEVSGSNILINATDFYNIYFKPGENAIYITKG